MTFPPSKSTKRVLSNTIYLCQGMMPLLLVCSGFLGFEVTPFQNLIILVSQNYGRYVSTIFFTGLSCVVRIHTSSYVRMDLFDSVFPYLSFEVTPFQNLIILVSQNYRRQVSILSSLGLASQSLSESNYFGVAKLWQICFYDIFYWLVLCCENTYQFLCMDAPV